MIRNRLMIFSALIIAALGGGRPVAAADPEGTEFFEQHVRPLLIARCYKCHSAESETLQGGLLLDSREGWAKGGDSGPAIVPGDPDGSLLVSSIRYGDDSFQMPPDGKLPEEEIAILTRWVQMGAPDPRDAPMAVAKPKRQIDLTEESKHWAYQPLSGAQPPEVNDAGWSRTPVDRFIAAKHHENGLSPNPAADRRTLIRRAYLDVIGLPPTPEQVEAFLQDSAPDAYEKVVDQLLASPHYGERWGRHWLDLVRFAESHGFEHDYDRPSAYHYRDFVIQALNQDLPYDTFVKWQIAGDELAPEDPLALMATGFLAAGVHSTQITKSQVEKERYDELDDMLGTVGTSMLGLTISCARCHDHKFDPIPTKDYYRLLSTFTTAVRSEIDVNFDKANYDAAKAAFDQQHAALQEQLAKFESEQLPARLEAWAKTFAPPAAPARWQVLEPVSIASQGGAAFTRLEDGSHLAGGANPDSDVYTFVAHTHLKDISSLRIEALAHESFPQKGPGRAANGNFALSDLRVTVAPLSGEGEPTPVTLISPRASFEQTGLPLAAAIDADPKSGWAVDPQFGKDHAAAFDLQSPAGMDGGIALTVTLKFETNTAHSIGRLRLAISTSPQPPLDAPSESQSLGEIQAILAQPAEQRGPQSQADLLRWYKPLDEQWQSLAGKVQEHLKTAPQLQLTKVLITSEGLPAVRLHTQGEDFLPETHFLERGDPTRKKEVVTQGFLQVLTNDPRQEAAWQVAPPAGSRTSFRRASLANWLTDSEKGAGHVLARVIVNRLWQHHLGRGIVATPSDFGKQGEAPTHPELLDWLAAELIRGGWRLKPMHKLMMTSAAYMQNSDYDPAKAAIDRDNLLVWRHNRRRLEGEVIRDSILAVSGSLDRRMFGPGTLDAAQRRRSIYFTVKRSQLVPVMMLFDAPDALQGIGQRPTTTIAPQALLLMNNPQVREYARAFAARLAPDESVPLEAAIQSAYLNALARPPSSQDTEDALAFIQQQVQSYQSAGVAEARQLAVTDFCQTLFCLNEFAYVE